MEPRFVRMIRAGAANADVIPSLRQETGQVNQAISRFLQRLRPDLAASFTAEQLAAVELHFGMRHRVTHAIDWRRHVRLPFMKIYVVLLAGRDHRTD